MSNEKKGLMPNTSMEKECNLGKSWVIGETLITGIGQGYTTNYSVTVMFNDSSNS